MDFCYLPDPAYCLLFTITHLAVFVSSSPALLLTIGPHPFMPSAFTSEQGRQPLAEALFTAARFRIRCPQCPGNDNQPGYIKDEAGKRSTEQLKRRFWTCQRSNGTGIQDRCRRISCTEYIRLAQTQLSSSEFSSIVKVVLAEQPVTTPAYAVLQSYLSIAPTPTQTLLTPAAQPARKRKAEQEDGPDTKRLHNELSLLQSYASTLTTPVVTSTTPVATWQQALNQLRSQTLLVEQEVIKLATAFLPSLPPLLATSPPTIVLPTLTPAWSSSLVLSPRSSPRLPPESSPPSSPLQPLTLLPALPCILPLDTLPLQSVTPPSKTPPSLPILRSDAPSPPEKTPIPPHTLLPPLAITLPAQSSKVSRLVERFRQSPNLDKSSIRREAQREGVYGAFQHLLRQPCSGSDT